MSWEGINF